MPRKIVLLFVVVAFLTFSLLIYIQCNYPSTVLAKAKPEVIEIDKGKLYRKCYAACCNNSLKFIDKIAPHCITRLDKKRKKVNVDCMLKVIRVVSDSCKSKCRQ